MFLAMKFDVSSIFCPDEIYQVQAASVYYYFTESVDH